MTLEDDGVVLLKDALGDISPVVSEYESHASFLSEIPKHLPIVVFWTHVIGQQKRIALLDEMPEMRAFASEIADVVREFAKAELRLLETIIFNKPPGVSNTLGWHQDVSYFALEPNNQLAVWIPFDKVTKESGAMVYALGSHLKGIRASADLHTGRVFDGEKRPVIDVTGMDCRVMEMDVGDMLIHDGRTWHMSGPNTVEGRQRRGLSLRFIVGQTYYHPRAGSAAAFLKQLSGMEAGDRIDDPAFPVL